jgi:hypothetical protein
MLMLTMVLSVMVYGTLKAQVPDNVQHAFSKQYPNGEKARWMMNHDTSVAEFKMDGSKNMVYYLPDGQWIKTETKIPWTKDLPMAVNDAWKYSDFASWYVSAIKEVTYPDSRNVYVMKVERDCGPEGSVPGDCDDIYKLYYRPDGSLVKKIHSGD